jgi:DNA-binding NtrC family response regulator
MPRILVINEDKAMQLLYADELGGKGYDVISADASAPVAALIEQTRPDLVVLDVSLRKQNVSDLYHAIRSRHQALPVILSTNNPRSCSITFPGKASCVLKDPRMGRLKQEIDILLAPSPKRAGRSDARIMHEDLLHAPEERDDSWQPISGS